MSVKSTTLIQKILDEYARRYQLEPLNLRLMFDGSHLSKTSTVGAVRAALVAFIPGCLSFLPQPGGQT